VLANEAIAAIDPQGDPRPAATALNNLSAYLTALGRCDESRNYARQALALARDVQFGVSVAISLQHVAATALFCATPDAARAARLLGYANAQVVALEAMREYTEQQEYDKMLATLRDTFGDDELAKLLTEGAAWSEDQAVAEAMLI
jgi:hypothetical protein